MSNVVNIDQSASFMPAQCWSYALAFALAAFISWFFADRFLKHVPHVATSGALGVAKRAATPGLFTLASTGGTVLLGRWGAPSTPAIGWFWIIGCVVGIALRSERAVRVISSANYKNLSEDDQQTLRRRVRSTLLTDGLASAREQCRIFANDLLKQARKDAATESLRKNIRELQHTIRIAQTELETLKSDRSRIANTIVNLATLLTDVSIADYSGFDQGQREAQLQRYLLQLLNSIAEAMGGLDACSCSIYLLSKDHEHAKELPPYAWSKPVKTSSIDMSRNGWVCRDAMSLTHSLLKLCLQLRRPVFWPEDTAAAKHFARTDGRNWPNGAVFPVPFVDEQDDVPKVPRRIYAALVVRQRAKGAPISPDVVRFCVASVSLIDLLIRLTQSSEIPGGQSPASLVEAHNVVSKSGYSR